MVLGRYPLTISGLSISTRSASVPGRCNPVTTRIKTFSARIPDSCKTLGVGRRMIGFGTGLVMSRARMQAVRLLFAISRRSAIPGSPRPRLQGRQSAAHRRFSGGQRRGRPADPPQSRSCRSPASAMALS